MTIGVENLYRVPPDKFTTPSQNERQGEVYRSYFSGNELKEGIKTGEIPVVFVGCGFTFTDSSIRGMLNLGMRNFVFNDLNEKMAESYVQVAQSAAENICPGKRISARAEPDLEKAVTGAGLIYVAIGSPYSKMQAQLEIYKKHGVPVSVGDTMWSPSILKWLELNGSLEKISRAVSDNSHPEAVILNYTNPLAMSVDTLTHAPGGGKRDVIGFCRGLADIKGGFDLRLGRPEQGITVEAVGRNHFYEIAVKNCAGESLLPELLQRFDPVTLLPWIIDDDSPIRSISQDWGLATLMRNQFDPDLQTTVITESGVQALDIFPHLFTRNGKLVDEGMEKAEEIIRKANGHLPMVKMLLDNPRGYERVAHQADGWHDAPTMCARGAIKEITLTQNVVNRWGPIYIDIPNQGLIPDLQSDTIVEVRATIDENGNIVPQPASFSLRKQYLEIVRRQLTLEHLGKMAASASDQIQAREYLRDIINICPQVCTCIPGQEERLALADELFEFTH